MNHVALVGAGHLGSRHLQALALLKIPVRLYVVDPNPESLQTAKKRFFQIHQSKNIDCIDFYSRISQLPQSIDFVIVATNADVRLVVLEELFRTIQPKHILLEKVLFQAVKDFEKAEHLFKKFNSKVWVNCPRRMYEGYRQIAGSIKPNSKIDYSVEGNQWGLACNSIHYIDHLSMYLGDTSYTLDMRFVDGEISKSKRSNFIELTGTITGKYSNGSTFSLTSNKSGNTSVKVKIRQDDVCIEVDETAGEIVIQESGNDSFIEIPLEMKFQSELTHIVVKDILESQTCQLTPYKESMELHLPLILEVTKLLRYSEKSFYGSCPIT